jgi:hypothetical protein
MSMAIAGGQANGRTRWRRVGILLLPAFALVATLVVLVAKGALAVNVAVSGQPFVLSATTIDATGGFTQYALPNPVGSGYGPQISAEEATVGVTNIPSGGTPTTTASGQTYEADTVSVLKGVTIDGLHQTICAPMIPGLGVGMLVSLDATSATSDAMTVDAPALYADSATFSGIQIGADLGAVSGGTNNGMFSQAANSVHLAGVNQVATNTEAAAFTLNGLKLNASFVSSCS